MHYSTAKEMQILDDLAVEHGLQIKQMMELAGWHIIEVFKKLNIKGNKNILVVVGKGNKGGDGLCAARHLSNHGHSVSVMFMSEDIKPNPQHHLELVKKMNLPVQIYDEVKLVEEMEKADIIIDALIGYQLQGNPRGNFGKTIHLINGSEVFKGNPATVIAYDLPSGLEPTTGEPQEPCINADATLTLALPKQCFNTESGKNKSGRIFLGDIGIPKMLYDKIKAGIRPDFGYGLIEL